MWNAFFSDNWRAEPITFTMEIILFLNTFIWLLLWAIPH